ncbi:MAG: hypothetical protein GF355_06625 [Candidatus Eisenbacteria bacterium]|nr:hypothetical protein [Candidatus Eisenbacteria bacterium]
MLKGVHHIVLFFKDTEAARDWYEKVGFVYARGYQGMHWFKLGTTELMLHPAKEPQQCHSTEIHAAVADVTAMFRHVVRQKLTPYDHKQPGVKLEEPVTRPWGDKEFELDDPEGHRWAFTQI